MNKNVLRTALFIAVYTGMFILLDLAVDRLMGGSPERYLPHVLLAAFATVVSLIFLNRAMQTRKSTDVLLRKGRDELEARVKERTLELEQTNAALQEEIVAHKQTEQERQQSLMLAEQARQQAEDLANELQSVNALLRESEERYRTQFDVFSEPTTVYDKNGVLLMENLVSAKNLGGRREDFIGKTIFDLFGDSAKGYMERITRVIETGVTENQDDVVELGIGTRYFWTCMQRIQNPDGEYAVQIISYDVTDHKRTEEALRASEEIFATVFHSSPDAIGIIRSTDDTVIDVNESFTRLLGYPRSEVIGKKWNEANLFQFQDEVMAIIKEFEDNGRVADHELDFMSNEGKCITALLSLVPIAIGGEACMLAIAHDITRRKRSEEELRRVQDELAMGIQERMVLEERQRLARELHDSVSQALYGISLGAHTALTLFDTDRGKALDALNYIISLTQAGLTEMRALIFELRPESLELEGLVVALTKQTAAMQARQEIQIELDLCEEPDVSLKIKEVLYRIAQEALHNAVKHARSDRVAVRLACEQEWLRLEVRDNGIGFDPQAAYPGHLGLRSMHERTTRLGGRLEISSVPHQGTTVQVFMPLTDI
jgi:PAS domain S-box-containing protein